MRIILLWPPRNTQDLELMFYITKSPLLNCRVNEKIQLLLQYRYLQIAIYANEMIRYIYSCSCVQLSG